ncbi:hypothetical protein ACFL4D_01115 [Candidatus Margulisiibacteriota bacterium]
MKTIVIAGAGRKSGKTTTLRALQSILPDSLAIKIGQTGAEDKGKPELLLPFASTMEDILQAIPHQPEHLLIEGNIILEKLQPDLAIFVDKEGPDRKINADWAKEKCDLIVGTRIDCRQAFQLAGRIGLNLSVFGQLLNKLQIKISSCQLGCF